MTDGDTESGDLEGYEEKKDELWNGLLEAYTAGYKKAIRDFEVTPEPEKYDGSEFISESHYYYWDGRTLPLDSWLREQFGLETVAVDIEIEDDIVTDGGTRPAADVDYYEDGSFVKCPDCDGELKYQNREVVLCSDCDTEFSHYYEFDGTNKLFRAPYMELVETVYDPADDQRDPDDEQLVTDGGEPLVYLTSANKSPAETYHHDRDCRYLKRATSVLEKPLDLVQDRCDPCSACTAMTDGGTPHEDIADEIATWTADAARCQLERHAKDQLSLEAINEAVERVESCVETVVTQQLEIASLADGHDHEIVTDGGLGQDIEKIGVETGEGEAWAEAAGRLRDRDDDRWHYCICGARYRSRRAALQCCGDRFDDLDDGGAGEIVTDGGESVVYYATGNYDVYHQRRDCRYLRRAESVRELLVSTMNGTREPCGGCVDAVDDSDSEGRLVADGGSVNWPAGFERTNPDDREPNRSFEVSMSDAFDKLEAELRRQNVDEFRYEFDANSRKSDQRPYSRASPDDPSFVLRWTKDGEQFAIACDAYSRLRDNVHAVGKYVCEKGRMQRRPVTTGKSEFANARLPSGDGETVVAAPPPHEVLDVSPDAPEGVVEAAYREKTKTMHPDHGGSTEAFQRLKRAKEAMLDA